VAFSTRSLLAQNQKVLPICENTYTKTPWDTLANLGYVNVEN